MPSLSRCHFHLLLSKISPGILQDAMSQSSHLTKFTQDFQTAKPHLRTMRLINAQTRQLEEYFESRVPPYAILSHCWGEGEVLFQDINSSEWHRKTGARKINFACAQTLKGDLNLNYVWIDTCCIDKSSSAELSEAINSMYRWYQNAKICYAYLDDVDQRSTDRSNKDFQQSRWFTRGWTLQELLAPAHVDFYDKYWTYIGNKEGDVLEQIATITSIPKRFIADPGLIPSASIAQKMSWAAGRKTTRTEDIAYCLLGLHNVNMPLLYGEGTKSFLRLQEEILKRSADQSLFAFVDSADREGDGIFAGSPDSFKDSRSIIPIPSRGGTKTQPHSLSNKGLLIETRYESNEFGDPLGVSPGEFYAVLECHYEYDYTSLITIALLDCSVSRDGEEGVFQRKQNGGLNTADVSGGKFLQMKTRVITIVQNQSSTTVSRECFPSVCIVNYNIARERGFEITETYPSSALWFGEQQTMDNGSWESQKATVVGETQTLRPVGSEKHADAITFKTRTFGFVFGSIASPRHFYICIHIWNDGVPKPYISLQTCQKSPWELGNWCDRSLETSKPHLLGSTKVAVRVPLPFGRSALDLSCELVIEERLNQPVVLLERQQIVKLEIVSPSILFIEVKRDPGKSI
ncbi:heterokaryon incompatibility protein-domain-containing protein [Tricladium varicosporioides]|nr:heterokaryon incompatibility protein-domain-containing protein [Hymenoscyphus varicosporioides]